MRLAQHANSRRDCSFGTGRRRGYVLYAVLIMIVVLSLLAYRFTDAMTTEYRGAQRTEDMAKLRSAAYSGITYAMANLADPATFMEMGGSAPYPISPSVFNNQSYFADQLVYQDPKGDTSRDILFSIVAVVPSMPGTYTQQYGVKDEGALININALAALDPSGSTLYNVLLQLPNLSQNQQVAANIVAYVLKANAPPPTTTSASGSTSSNSGPAPTGVPSSYYQSLSNPYYAKNGPLNTLDELLLVDGVTPSMLYGNDQNMNGYGDDYNTGGTSGSSGSNNTGYCDRGWQDYLTVNGREFNVTSSFYQGSTGSVAKLRINVNADSSGGSLSGIYSALQSSSIDQDLATYIMGAKLFGTMPAGVAVVAVNAKGNAKTTPTGTISQLQTAVQAKLNPSSSNNPSSSKNNSSTSQAPKGQPIPNLIASLMNTQVLVPVPSATGKGQQMVPVPSPLTTATASTYLPNLLDQVTTSSQVDLVPRVNLSTASQQVITALLLGMQPSGLFTQTDVQNVISAQASLVAGQPATTSGAWLITQAQLTPAKYQILSTFATGTSMMYRVQAIGYYRGTETGGNGGTNATNWPMARVEAIIDTNLGYPRIVYMRELTSLDNPRGFILPLTQHQ